MANESESQVGGPAPWSGAVARRRVSSGPAPPDAGPDDPRRFFRRRHPHGFVTVTIAEVAEAADVSVNTVYNYFPAKEDLFFDRSAGIVDRLARWVRGRDRGESAVAAVLRELRAEVEAVSPRVGLMEGCDRFMKAIHEAPALRSRLWSIQQEVQDDLEAALREETGAAPDDPLPT